MGIKNRVKALSMTPIPAILIMLMVFTAGVGAAYVLFWQSQVVTHTVTFKGLAGLFMGPTYADYSGKIDATDVADIQARRPASSELYTIEKAAVLAIDEGFFDSPIRIQIDASVSENVLVTCQGYWAIYYVGGAYEGATYWYDQPIAFTVNVNGGSEYTEIALATVNDRLMYETPADHSTDWDSLTLADCNALILSFTFANGNGAYGDIPVDITISLLGDDA